MGARAEVRGLYGSPRSGRNPPASRLARGIWRDLRARECLAQRAHFGSGSAAAKRSAQHSIGTARRDYPLAHWPYGPRSTSARHSAAGPAAGRRRFDDVAVTCVGRHDVAVGRHREPERLLEVCALGDGAAAAARGRGAGHRFRDRGDAVLQRVREVARPVARERHPGGPDRQRRRVIASGRSRWRPPLAATSTARPRGSSGSWRAW